MSGTSAMVLGSIVSAIGAYLFQVIGGRALGADAFAPVSVMWTVLFLGITIFLLPVEQLVIRRLTLANGEARALAESWSVIAAVAGGAALLSAAFAFVARETLLENDAWYALIAVGMMLGYAVYSVGRGFLAGRRRFVAYGASVAIDAVAKIGGAVAVAAVGMGPVALSSVFIVSPLVAIAAVAPFRRPQGRGDAAIPPDLETSDRRFIAGFLVATAASQTVLAAGPLVVGALGASSASISVFFVTTTLFRGPMSTSYNLVARILPGLTRRAATGEHAAVNRLVLRVAAAGTAAAAVVAAIAAALGPAVVELFYGADFRPSATLAGLAAAGVILGIVGLGTTQVLVGRGRTGRMAAAWLVAVAAAALAIVVGGSDPTIRVAWGFVAGEGAALLGLTAAVLAPERPSG